MSGYLPYGGYGPLSWLGAFGGSTLAHGALVIGLIGLVSSAPVDTDGPGDNGDFVVILNLLAPPAPIPEPEPEQVTPVAQDEAPEPATPEVSEPDPAEVETPEAPPLDELASNDPEETPPPEEIAPEEVTPPEEIAPEETTPPEEIAPEQATPPEEVAAEEVTPPEEIAPEEATPPEEIAPEETTQPEEIAPEQATELETIVGVAPGSADAPPPGEIAGIEPVEPVTSQGSGDLVDTPAEAGLGPDVVGAAPIDTAPLDTAPLDSAPLDSAPLAPEVLTSAGTGLDTIIGVPLGGATASAPETAAPTSPVIGANQNVPTLPDAAPAGSAETPSNASPDILASLQPLDAAPTAGILAAPAPVAPETGGISLVPTLPADTGTVAPLGPGPGPATAPTTAQPTGGVQVLSQLPLSLAAPPEAANNQTELASNADGEQLAPAQPQAENIITQAALPPRQSNRVPVPAPSDTDIALAKLADRLRASPPPDCTIALPRLAAGGGLALGLTGASQAGLTSYAASLADAGIDAAQRPLVSLVSPGQCAALDLFAASLDYPATGLGLRIDNPRVPSGGALTGAVRGAAGLYLTLLLIDDSGVVQDLRPYAQTVQGGEVAFAVPLSRAEGASAAGAVSQLVLAIATTAPQDALRARIGDYAEAVFDGLQGELAGASFALLPFTVE